MCTKYGCERPAVHSHCSSSKWQDRLATRPPKRQSVVFDLATKARIYTNSQQGVSQAVLSQEYCPMSTINDVNVRLLPSTIVKYPSFPFHCNHECCFLLHTIIHSDISGGYSPSILNAMRVAIHASKALSFTVNETDYQPLTHHEAFYLGTLGGAQGQPAHI